MYDAHIYDSIELLPSQLEVGNMTILRALSAIHFDVIKFNVFKVKLLQQNLLKKIYIGWFFLTTLC